MEALEDEDEKKTKKCPYCSEEILIEAKKCKHCKEHIGLELVTNSKNKDQKDAKSKFDDFKIKHKNKVKYISVTLIFLGIFYITYLTILSRFIPYNKYLTIYEQKQLIMFTKKISPYVYINLRTEMLYTKLAKWEINHLKSNTIASLYLNNIKNYSLDPSIIKNEKINFKNIDTENLIKDFNNNLLLSWNNGLAFLQMAQQLMWGGRSIDDEKNKEIMIKFNISYTLMINQFNDILTISGVTLDEFIENVDKIGFTVTGTELIKDK